MARPVDADTLTIRTHTNLADVEDVWRAAERRLACYAFQSFEWMRSWQDTCGVAERMTPAITVISESSGCVVMLLPLGISRTRRMRELSFLGGNVTDYNAPLIDPAFAGRLDSAAVASLWRRITTALPRHDVVRLLRMPATIDGPDGAAVPNPFAVLPSAAPAGAARSVRLPSSHEQFRKSLKPRFVAANKNRLRRLAEIAPVSLQVAQDAAGMQDVLAALIRQKSRRWHETAAKDWFAVAHFHDFYTAMSARRPADGQLHASMLRVGDTVVAVHWGLVWRRRFYYLMIGWEAGDWRRFSPGRLLTDRLIEVAIADGLATFDFTIGDEPYKQDWTDTILPLFACVRAATLPGHIALAVEATLGFLHTRARRVLWLRQIVVRSRRRWLLPGA